MVEDLQSTSGTKVNAKWVRSAMLRLSHEIRNGNTSFRFEMGSPSEV